LLPPRSTQPPRPPEVMPRLVFIALAFVRAVSLHVGFQAECSHDGEAAIRSIQNKQGSLWVFHTTHNAGTSIKALLEQNLPPATYKDSGLLPEYQLEAGRYYYGAFAGEGGLKSNPLNEQVPCDSNKFLSVYPMRHPLVRILAGDGNWITTADANTDKCNTDNYGLRKLIGKNFGEPLNRTDVELAKQRLESFDIILDVMTLDESVGAMCQALGFRNCALPTLGIDRDTAKTEEDVLERVGQERFNEWKVRNGPEIEVYQYGQKLAAAFVDRYPGPPADVRPLRLKSLDGALSTERWICPT